MGIVLDRQLVGQPVLRLWATEAEGPAQVAPDQLRTRHRKLLAAATLDPESAKRLARRAGYTSAHSGVRDALALLVRSRMLLHTPDGYCLPD